MKTNRVSLIILFLLLILFNACSTFQSDRSFIQKRIDSLFVSDFFKSSQAAISVYDLSNDKPIYQLNEKLLLRPASNLKILTTAASLFYLGSDYKISTPVYYSGEIKDSICDGNIYVASGFDPEFSLHDLDSLSKEIKKFGIKEIKGNLYGDISSMDSLFWGNGWMWDDDPSSYIPYLSPLTVNKNCVKIFYEPGEIGKPADVFSFPSTNFIQIENHSTTVTEGRQTFSVSRDWVNRKNTIIVKGSILKNAEKDSVKLNLVNPEFYFLNLLKDSFSKDGITFNGKVDTLTMKAPVKNIFTFRRPIQDAINRANKYSDNLSAELLLRLISQNKFGKNASAEKGKVFIDSLITRAGLNPAAYRIADGSGLSLYNLVSAELLVNILKLIFEQAGEARDFFMHSLPIAGIDGTLSNRFKNFSARGHVFAKTGGLSGISSLSGFIETAKNNKLAFSILIQNFVNKTNEAREIQDKICQLLYEGL